MNSPQNKQGAPRRAQRIRTLVGSLLVVLGATVLTVASPVSARAEDQPTTVQGAMAFTGAAADVDRGVIWGLTSATVPEVLAINAQGKVAHKVTMSVTVTGLEALAYRGGRLYVGDIGSASGRSTIKIHRLADLSDGAHDPVSYTLAYPDGEHDAGAMLLSPKGNFYIVTKGSDPGIYRAAQPSAGNTTTMTRVADAPGGVTDGTFTADGSTMALRLGSQVTLVDAYSFEQVASGTIPGQVSGDALTTELNGPGLLAANGSTTKATITPMSLPVGFTTASPTPTPTSKPSSAAPKPPSATVTSPAASASPGTGVGDTSNPKGVLGSQSRGTWIALGGAAGLAVCAGLLTLVRRPGTDPEDDQPQR